MAKAKGKRGNSEGSIYRLTDGTWRAVLVTGRDPSTGKLKRKYLRAPTRQEAYQRLAQAQGQVISRTMIEPSTITVSEWLDLYWRDYCFPNKVAGTSRACETVYRVHAKPMLGHLRLSQLRREHIQRWYNRLLASGRVQESTAYDYVALLSMALRQAVDNKLISNNPCEGLTRADVVANKRDYDFLAITEAKHFLESLGDDPWVPVWAVALYAGLRCGELIGLRWQDVDLDIGQIHIRQQIQRLWFDAQGQRTSSVQVPIAPKSAADTRIIPISGEVIALWRRNKARQAEERLLYGALYDESCGDLVFCRLGGSPLPPSSTNEQLGRQLQAAGLPRLRIHDLRHTYATILDSLGTPIRTIKYLLGHASVETTETYLHILHKRMPPREQLIQQREAASRLALALSIGTPGSNVAATQPNPAS